MQRRSMARRGIETALDSGLLRAVAAAQQVSGRGAGRSPIRWASDHVRERSATLPPLRSGRSLVAR
jgi:hypothetical protein